MAIVKVINDGIETRVPDVVRWYLESQRIEFGTFDPGPRTRELVAQQTLSDEERAEVIAIHSDAASRFKSRPGYRADVVCFHPDIPQLHFIVEKFGSIHYHFENEYWFFCDGAATFGFLAEDGTKFVVTVEAGEYLQVPEGRWQWFELTADKRMKAIRFFYRDGKVQPRAPVMFDSI